MKIYGIHSPYRANDEFLSQELTAQERWEVESLMGNKGKPVTQANPESRSHGAYRCSIITQMPE